jgi:acyl carrier protein
MGDMGVEPQVVVELICTLLEPFNEDGVELSSQTDLTSDLHIDSVAIMDLVMLVEDTYDISIPINSLSDMRTVKDLATVVHTIVEAA